MCRKITRPVGVASVIGLGLQRAADESERMISDPDVPPRDAAPSAGSRRLVDALTVGFLTFDSEGRLIDCDASVERVFRRPREALIGRPASELGGLGDTPLGALVRRVAATKDSEDAEVVVRHEGVPKLLDVHVFPVGEGVQVDWSNITAARAAELRLALSETRYRDLADGTPAAAWLSRADGALIYVNQAMVEALGRPRWDLLGHGWIEALDPQDRDQLLAARATARAEHSSLQYEARFRRPDGSRRTIQLYGRPRFDFRGEFCGHVGLARDVTEARGSEERRTALVNELNHRVKNTLATVQSLVRHTLREHGVPREVERALIERVMALSMAHDVLNRESWTGADLSDLAEQLLRPYGSPERISTAGPGARISPRSAIALAMSLQELAHEAVAHGALSAPEGHVELDWEADDKSVVLEWRESGGPATPTPPSGFGALVLGRMLAADLGAPAEMIRAPEGLICRMRAPLIAGGHA